MAKLLSRNAALLTPPSDPQDSIVPATLPAPSRNPLIALVDDGSDPALATMAQAGVLAGLAGGEFALTLCRLPGDTEAGPAALRQFLERHRPMGVILLPPLGEVAGLAAQSMELGARTICLTTLAEDAAAARAAVSQLALLGHSRIGVVAGPERIASARVREAACMEALSDHEFADAPALVAYGDNSFASGVEAGRLLLEVSPRPTAILALNDEMAAGVLRAAAQAGLAVPDDLSVAGIGDTPLAPMLSPPLASASIPAAELAMAAVTVIVDPASYASGEARGTTFVFRSSVAPPAPLQAGDNAGSRFQSG